MKKIRVFIGLLIYVPKIVWGQDFVPYSEAYDRLIQGIDFSPSGDTIYFTLPHAERLKYLGDDTTGPRLALYMAYIQGDDWSDPELMPFSGTFDDYEPNLSADGSLLFFNSKRPINDDSALEYNNLWYAQKVNGEWPDNVTPLSALNRKDKEESYASIDNENQLFYMSEFEVNGSKGYGIYVSSFRGTSTLPGTKIFGSEERFFGDPCINASGDTLIMTGWTPEAWESACDLFISYKSNGNWSTPQPLKVLNSTGPDFSPSFSPDRKFFYYRRNYGFVRVRWDP